MTMTRKERVQRAVAHQESDIVPYHMRFQNPDHVQAWKGLLGDDLDDAMGNHFAFFRPDAGMLTADGRYLEFGTGIDGYHTYMTPEMAATYPFPDPEDPKRMAQAAAVLANAGDRFVFFDLSRTLLERAEDLRGQQQILEDLLGEPEMVEVLFDRILEWDLRMLQKSAGMGFDGVRFGDDWGSQRALLMSPAKWRAVIKPRMQQLFAASKKMGYPILLHSCGAIDAVIPDLIDMGLDILEPIQPEVMDVFAIKKTFGANLSFWGGVSLQQVLTHGTPDEVEKEVREKLKRLGAGGGYICGASHTLTVDVPDNVMVVNLKAGSSAYQ